MRVALLSLNARAHDAVGNHIAETAGFFLERGADVRLFVQSVEHLHPELASVCRVASKAEIEGPVWEFLSQADVVVAQYAQFYELLEYLPLLSGLKPRILLDYHGVTPPEFWRGSNKETLEKSQRERGLVWCADQAIAHSQFMCQELVTATRFPVERVRRLELVVDRQQFHPGTRSRFLHERLGLAESARLLLFVGRLAANKGIPYLVEALARLADARPEIHAVVVGDQGDVYADEARRCQELAERLGVARSFHLLGQLEASELQEAYRSAHLLVVPSRHEGFCVPVIEAMASGLPVLASRCTALPETVANAGLTFSAGDADDLAVQIRHVLFEACPAPLTKTVARRIGIVCFRFGKEIVGGAESSLRTIAQSLQSAGQHVEVFTTCTQAEGDWKNELPAGTTVEAGLVVHRFPMDRHDRERHLAAVRRVNEAADVVAAADEQEYLRHSIHSSALLDALRQREDFDALIVGPYLFGLTHDVAEAFPKKTLLLPCFHDEPLARLGAWPATYGKIGGILLHSPEEQELMQTRLGVNHPSAVVIDTFLEAEATAKPQPARPYLVYCGRYSRQKNVPLLLEWFARYQRECPGRFILVFIGLGEVEIPKEPWLRDLGRVNETTKRETLAGAAALIQLSEQESLSLVALEAWRQETPVIVHRRCAVLAGQVERSGGGATVVDFPAFAAALDDLSANSTAWRERGSNGARYVEARYASRDGFVRRLLDAIDALAVPVRDLMVRQGLERARACDRPAWRESFGRIIDNLLHEPARVPRLEVELEPLHRELHAALDARTVLLPVRIHNRGDTALFSEGPGRTRLCATVRASGATRIERSATGGISGIILPGQTQMAMVVVAVPAQLGAFEISVTAEARRGHASVPIAETTLRLNVSDQERHSASCLAPFLDGIRRAITRAHLLEQLPDDYLDVTEGRFARAKRWVKKKLLNNFKHGYVDVVSRQQTQVNQQLVLAVQQLSECCAALESAVQGLQRRVDDTEVRSAAGSEHDEALAR